MVVCRIGVVGAGKMGVSIALSVAIAGYSVTIHDVSESQLESAGQRIREGLARRLRTKAMSRSAQSEILGRISTTCTYEDFGSLDFVIESITESLAAKREVFGQLDAICREDTILVSGTSTLSITAIAEATERPSQVAGMHFFLPPSELVEIIQGRQTSDETVAHVRSVAEATGKLCVHVRKDTPGFVANRVYTPLFLEAFRVYEEGIATKEEIDLALMNTYLPVGPFKLADIIGLDVLLSGLEYFESELGEEWKAPESLRALVDAGRLGRKTGRGWYDYKSTDERKDQSHGD
jgi:3-hydroxybutyryl-CoA dehydrogenase